MKRFVSEWRLVVLLVWIAVTTLGGAPARAADEGLTCDGLIRGLVEAQGLGADPSASIFDGPIMATLRRVIGQNPGSEDQEAADAHFMTATSGNALFIDCSSGLRRLVYFPVGRVLRERVSFEQDGASYVVGETEHGLHLIFDREWLVPIGPEDVFFIWEGFGDMPLCLGGEVTAGRCDPFARSRDDEPLMSGDASYTHATFEELASFGVTRPYLEWLDDTSIELATTLHNPMVEADVARQYYEEAFGDQSAEGRAWLSALCHPINVGALYNQGRRPGHDKADFEAVTLSLCQRPLMTEIPVGDTDETLGIERELRPLKIVTLDKVKAAVPPTVSMVFPNASDLGFRALIEVSSLPDISSELSLHNLLPSLHTKQCRQQLKQSREDDLSRLATLQVGGGVPALQLQGILRTHMENSQTIGETYGADEFYRTSALWILAGVDGKPISEFQDIRMISNCNEDTATELRTIDFEHPRVENNRMTIAANDLLAVYNLTTKRARDAGHDYIVENYGREADSTRLTDVIRRGVFWQIKDHTEYLLWRSTLRTMLGSDPKVHTDYFGSSTEGERRHLQMLDHYTHVLMTAVFRSGFRERPKPLERRVPVFLVDQPEGTVPQ